MLKRREFLKTVGLAAVPAMPAISATMTGRRRKPNIVFVMLDDAGIGDFGCYGQKKIKTPVMDRMAAEGMRFTQAYTGSPVCAPCRCILMTGLHSGHCTRRGNRTKDGKRRLIPLRSDDFTVAAMLKEAGYVTGGFGKWGLGNPGTTGTPDKHGFDHFYGYLDQMHAHTYYTSHLWKDGKDIPLKGNKKGRKTQYSHDLIADAALDFIREYKDKPFFLYLPFTPPHGKYVVPDDAPYSNKPWGKVEKNYAAMITRADRDVGRVLKLLDELGLDKDTIVFYTSDNGPNRRFLKRFNSAAGLRGIKRRLYEGGIRMPMVVRWPGRVPAKQISDFAWTFADFMPTATEIAGVEPPEKLDGMSILPTLLGKRQEPHDVLYWEFHSPFHQAVRMGRWKGIRFGTEMPMELYDMKTDAGEKHDVASKHRDVVRAMEKFLETARTKNKYWPERERRSRRRK